MRPERQFVVTTVALGLATIGHALLTWPLEATLAFFAGGALIAFVAEAIAVNLDYLEHTLGRTVLGAPLYVLFGWTGVVYVAFRLALLVVDPWLAVPLAAVLATAYDIAFDQRGVDEGYWSYDPSLRGPWHGDVPFLNYATWLAISTATTAIAVPFL